MGVDPEESFIATAVLDRMPHSLRNVDQAMSKTLSRKKSSRLWRNIMDYCTKGTPMIKGKDAWVLILLLKKTLSVPGDVVEIGCHKGRTTVAFQSLLNYFGVSKQIYAYDSFQGLPPERPDESYDLSYYEKTVTDKSWTKGSTQGLCHATIGDFEKNMLRAGVEMPIVREGWLEDTLDSSMPDRISFAFFDVDMYSSTKTALNRLVPRMSIGAIGCIHDYSWHPWREGVRRACQEELRYLVRPIGAYGVFQITQGANHG